MPTTRKKVIKTVYKDEHDSDEGGDFSDSGSDAELSQPSSSEEDLSDHSIEEFKEQPRKKQVFKTNKSRNTNFTKTLLNKIKKQSNTIHSNTQIDEDCEEEIPFSVKDLTEADKLLPAVLNLSDSDSSDDEVPKVSHKKDIGSVPSCSKTDNSDSEINMEYKDVWSHNNKDESEEIARKTYLELEKHKNKIEETKKSIQNYVMKVDTEKESNIKDLLALGEENSDKIESDTKFKNDDSDEEMEDWEEVKESKGIPKQGLQLIVDVPEALCRKRKKVDVEMILKRKANRHTKESQLYKHKVHVLCWLGHGNYVSRVLNDQEILSAVLSLLPSKECYPGEKVDTKYIEEITTWYKDKIIFKQDKHENKFKPKAPPLKTLLLQQIKSKVFSTKKYIVFAFVSMLRSLGLQCRVMLNFVTLPIRPPSVELLSLSTKSNDKKDKPEPKSNEKTGSSRKKTDKKNKIPQLDGDYDICNSEIDDENIMQLDGNDDKMTIQTRKAKNKSRLTDHQDNEVLLNEDHVSPPKKARRQTRSQLATSQRDVDLPDIETTNITKIKKNSKTLETPNKTDTVSSVKSTRKSLSLNRQVKQGTSNTSITKNVVQNESTKSEPPKKTPKSANVIAKSTSRCEKRKENNNPKIIVSEHTSNSVSSKYFENTNEKEKSCRKRSQTTEPSSEATKKQTKPRTRSAQGNVQNSSKYFENINPKDNLKSPVKKTKAKADEEDNKRISHKELKEKLKSKKDVADDLIQIIKGRIKEAKSAAHLGVVKGKIKKESDDDSDYLPVESPKRKMSGSDEDFKIKKSTPKVKVSSATKKKDRRVLSTDDELPLHKIDVWAEVFVEELEEWMSVDVIEGKVHCAADIYRRATHPVAYVVGWDNNNNIKDLTRRYVPHWNTVTRKQRVDPLWWENAVKPWLAPKTAREREEDERLDRMQLEAPLPKCISEYKNHPLYALSRHLLKFEAIYPPDAPSLGFVRGEPVYARSCVYVCRSRDTWLKEAKVVRLGEQPYKVVKARPKWDRLSNKLITDKPLEVFGPWQVQDYEPPTAENGVVPRNAYGNVELFKDCMLPKGTVHIKLPGLNRVAKKLNIDCAPAMTGFDFNGGWSHPVYDGFVVCKEFEEVITEAWVKDQEEQERKEVEKLETRVYGNWKKLIKGLLIRERLRATYGFENPGTSKDSTKSKGPKLVVKKKSRN